jgi:hypothetical protein
MELIAILTLVITFITLVITHSIYEQKRHIDISSSYIIKEDNDCEDYYISKVILRNNKDLNIGIFAIYLHIPPNFNIQLIRY